MANSYTIHPPPGRMILHTLARSWWLILLGSVLTFFWPVMTLVTLVLLYGAHADGPLALVAAIKGDKPARKWLLTIVGLLGMVAGLATLLLPGTTVLVLLFFIVFWPAAIGAMRVAGTIKLHEEIGNERLLIVGGMLSVLFGISLLMQPGVGALRLVVVIAVFALIHGVMLVALAFILRPHTHATR